MEWVKEVTQLASSIAPFSDPTICDDPFKCDEDTIIPDTICGKLAKRNQIRSQCNYCANECILTKLGQKFPKIIVGKNVELKKPSDFKLYTTAGNGLRIYIANNTSGS
ncbi:hypothetical protein M8J75_009107 [Diaphorina citri]|nr:hypothetical protein M8J75_009107 [Diaphorina citri]